MTTFETLDLVSQFGLTLIATLTFLISFVVFLNKKKQPPRPKVSYFFFVIQLDGQPLFMRSIVVQP